MKPEYFLIAAVVLIVIVAFAHANPEVMAVIAFLWPSPPWAEDIEKGIADMPELREKYVAAGLSITGGAV